MSDFQFSRSKCRHLEDLGRISLSKNFLLREFLYSEVAIAHGLVNIPTDLDLAVDVGSRLCEELLEPIQEKFGRISVRSGYRSTLVNELGHRLGLNCSSNKRNAASHIWDIRDERGAKGATTCVVIPSFWEEYHEKGDWRILADWIDRHLSYSKLCFFPKLWAFNIQWHEAPKREIRSYAEPKGRLSKQLGLPLY